MLKVILLALLLPQDEAKVKKHEELEDAHPSPVVYSPDGKSLLFIKRLEDKSFVYVRADAHGKGARAVYETPVDWDDILNATIGPYIFSPDGKRIVVATTKDGESLRGNKDPLRAGVVADGKLTKLDCGRHQTYGAGFAGDRVVYIDSADFKDKGTGYTIRLWDGKETKDIDKSEDDVAALLRVSPKGDKAAFFVMDMEDRQLALRVVNLNTKEKVTSKSFRSDDLTFDGAPLFYWDAEGKGIFYMECTAESGKRPYSLMYFDIAKKASREVIGDENVAILAVLDKDHIAVLVEEEDRRCGILRLSDKKTFLLPKGLFILGGRGKSITIRDKAEGITYAAEFELPK